MSTSILGTWNVWWNLKQAMPIRRLSFLFLKSFKKLPEIIQPSRWKHTQFIWQLKKQRPKKTKSLVFYCFPYEDGNWPRFQFIVEQALFMYIYTHTHHFYAICTPRSDWSLRPRPREPSTGASWAPKMYPKMVASWMSQEVSKRLGSGGYNPNIPHL